MTKTRFLCADFSAIEARAEAYLAGEESVLEDFRAGRDAYKVSAAGTFNVPYEKVDKKQRQVGKVSILALGYGGGIGAYATMAKGYNLDLETLPPLVLPTATKEELEGPYGAAALAKGYLTLHPDAAMSLEAAIACDVVKRRWRAVNPHTVMFWKGLGQAAYQAVEQPGQVFSYRAIKYVVHKDFLKCLMPSGRVMHYYQPRIKPVIATWGEEKLAITYMGMKIAEGGATTRQWIRLPTHGAKLAENCLGGGTQILTPAGWIHLDTYQAGTPVWDGIEFVTGGALLRRGEQKVISYLGTDITPDHLVLTEEGWKEANEARRFDRPKVLLPDGYRLPRNDKGPSALESALRLRKRVCDCWLRAEEASADSKVVWVYDRGIYWARSKNSWLYTTSRVLGLAVDGRPLPTADAPGLEKLRRAWNTCVRTVGYFVRGLLGRYGTDVSAGAHDRPNGQQRELQSRELQVGDTQAELEQQAQQQIHKHPMGADDGSAGRSEIRGGSDDDSLSYRTRMAGRQAVGNAGFCQLDGARAAWAEVYDIQNCGPRHRFVACGADGVPFIAHNCTQGYCRDLLSAAMLRLERAGYPIVFHVHDECGSELPEDQGSLEEFIRIMEIVPAWAAGMPIKAEGWFGRRYRK